MASDVGAEAVELTRALIALDTSNPPGNETPAAELLECARLECGADGAELGVRQGRDPMAAETEAVCGPTEAASFCRFCDWLQRLYDAEMARFIERNFDSPLDLVRPVRPARCSQTVKVPHSAGGAATSGAQGDSRRVPSAGPC